MAADAEIIDIHCGWGASAAAPEWGDAGRLRDALRARGVGTAFLAADLGRRFDFVEGNAEVADVIARFPELRGWLVLHPARMADANAQMRRYLYGERFVGCALYPDPLTGKPVTLRAALELINMFRRFAKPLLVQADTAAAMEEVAAIAQEMTGMRVIASGMGGDDWREAVDLAVRPLNLYLDISGALVPEKIEYAISSLNGVRKTRLRLRGAAHRSRGAARPARRPFPEPGRPRAPAPPQRHPPVRARPGRRRGDRRPPPDARPGIHGDRRGQSRDGPPDARRIGRGPGWIGSRPAGDVW
jgi:hypothetical protein